MRGDATNILRKMIGWNILNNNEQGELDLPLPSCAIGENNKVFLCWDKEEHHFEIEIYNDHIELFYRNRLTNEMGGDEVSSELLNKLQNFLC